MRRRNRYPDDATILTSFESYLLDELGRSPITCRGYRQQLQAVARMLDKQIAAVTPTDMRYQVKRDPSSALSTKQLRFAAYKQLHRWALLEELVWANAGMLAIPAPTGPPRKPQPALSLPQARILLGACRTPNQYRIVYLGLFAGCRVSESTGIGADNWRGDRLVFVGKGNKQRVVPVHRELARHRDIILSSVPASKGVLMDVFTKLRKRTGVLDESGEPPGTHTLRRTYALTLYERFRAPREVIAQLLGHGDSVTRLYAPVRYEVMRECVDRLSYYDDLRRNNRRMVAEILENGGIAWCEELLIPRRSVVR